MTQIAGTIKVIMDTEQVSEKFAKRNLVVTTDDMYPQDLQVQFTQDKCGILDGYNENERVIVDINLRGRGWTNPQGKEIFFVTLEAWKIAKDTGSHESQEMPTANAPERPEANGEGEDDNDLPF